MQVLEDTLEAIRRLTEASFAINLKKSHLAEDPAKVLGYYWLTDSFWAPNIDKLQALISKTDEELGRILHPSLYGLMNFYREHILGRAPLTPAEAGCAPVDTLGRRSHARGGPAGSGDP